MPYKFIKYGDKEEVLLEMTEDYYHKLLTDLLEAPTDARRVEVMAEFLPADIKNIVKPEDT